MIVVFGGTFDPVHSGHVKAAELLSSLLSETDSKETVSEGSNRSRLLVMPAFVNPFKVGTVQGASAMQRFEMCSLAFEGIPHCEISDREISSDTPSYTYDTLCSLREKHPHERIGFALGSDTFCEVTGWRNSERLIKGFEIFTFRRERQFSFTKKLEEITAMGGRVTVLENEPVVISSTRIREMIRNREDLHGLIPERVMEYIKEQRLYGYEV